MVHGYNILIVRNLHYIVIININRLGKSPAELACMKECPLDPGGYFIVKGAEKVILMQEQMSKNRIIVDQDSQGGITCCVTSSTHYRKSKTTIIQKRDRHFVEINCFADSIPVMVMFKAFGFDIELEVFQMVGSEDAIVDALLPDIEFCRKQNVSHILHIFFI